MTKRRLVIRVKRVVKKKKRKLTPAERRHLHDLRYRRVYGKTLEEKEKLDARFGNRCWICRSKSSTGRLHTDHDHKVKYFKIVITKRTIGDQGFIAAIPEVGVREWGKNINEAKRAARKAAKTKSVRGSLCFPCNGGLRKFHDNPEYLENAARYLRAYKASL